MMSTYQRWVRPLFFRCDPERAHDLAIRAARVAGGIGPFRRWLGARQNFPSPRLETRVAGLRFANPIGLAAGFDKNGHAAPLLAALGFGHLEVGSVSAKPSAGNPRPRLWRLPDDEAIRVHYGLPNDGAEVIAARLRRARPKIDATLGVNLVSTNQGPSAPMVGDEEIVDDYVHSARAFSGVADFLVLNLSCPNTADGRDRFADTTLVRRLLSRLDDARVAGPWFLKVAPTVDAAAIDRLLECVDGFTSVAGLAINLAPTLPEGLRTPAQSLAGTRGAVSGRPAAAIVDASLAAFARRMPPGRFDLIVAGGVFSAQDAYRKIQLGASLVQIYTALIYEGPAIVARIQRELAQLLDQDGFRDVAETVGCQPVPPGASTARRIVGMPGMPYDR